MNREIKITLFIVNSSCVASTLPYVINALRKAFNSVWTDPSRLFHASFWYYFHGSTA